MKFKTTIRPQARTIIQKVIQTPRQPPPRIVDREVCEPAGPPIIRTTYEVVDYTPREEYNMGCSQPSRRSCRNY